MLSQHISDFYPWDSASRLANQSILVYDVDSGCGEFAIVEIMVKLLRQSQPVILLSSNHHYGHYDSVLRKFVSS